jgi:hypothetical protein
LFEFARVEGRAVVASFDGERMTSDAGALLLGAADRVIGLTRRLAGCFTDARNPAFIEHEVETLVMQRVVGIALGYEDLIDHDELRHDPVLATLAGKLAARRSTCAPLAGKSTLNRLQLSRTEPTLYGKLAQTRRRSRRCSSISSSTRTAKLPSRSRSISTRPTIRYTGTRKAGSSTATTTVTAIGHSTCSAVAICSQPSCVARTSTPPPAQWTRSGALSAASVPAGPACASYCAPIVDLLANR